METELDQYGVVGHPVGHSLSPFIHAMFARESGQNISYRLYDVAPGEFHARVRAFFAQGGRGLNVTLPHKIAAVDVAHELTPRAAHAAAAAAQCGFLAGRWPISTNRDKQRNHGGSV